MEKLSFYLKLLVNFLLTIVILSLILTASKWSKLILEKYELIDLTTSVSETQNELILITGLSFLFLIYLLWLILKFRKMVYSIKSTSLFSEKNEIVFRLVGKGLIYYSIGMYILSFAKKALGPANPQESSAYNLGTYFGTGLRIVIPYLVIALFMLIIAQLIKDGYHLKNENDLTI